MDCGCLLLLVAVATVAFLAYCVAKSDGDLTLMYYDVYGRKLGTDL